MLYYFFGQFVLAFWSSGTFLISHNWTLQDHPTANVCSLWPKVPQDRVLEQDDVSKVSRGHMLLVPWGNINFSSLISTHCSQAVADINSHYFGQGATPTEEKPCGLWVQCGPMWVGERHQGKIGGGVS